MGLLSNLPVRAELPPASTGGDRRKRNADGAFWSPTRGTYQGLQANPSYLPQGVSLYSQYDDLTGANPWDLIDTSSELGTGNLQAASIPKWLRDLGGRAGPAITPGNVAFETFNPKLGRQDYYYTTEGLGPRDGDANNPGGLVDPDNFKRLAWDPRIVIASRTGDWSILNGMPYDVLDRSGNVIGQKLIEGMGQEDGVDQMVGMAAAALATAGAAGWLGGGSAAGAEAAGAGALDTAAFEGIGSSALGETTATMGASGSGLGSGLSGTGLSMGGGTTGLTMQAGTGLNLAGNAVAPGMMTAAAPGAGAIGAGLGTGFAGGAGTLLGPAALAGTYTLANGSILPALTSSLPAVPPVPPGAPGSEAAMQGVPPPANPYNPTSYLNPTNLANLATSGGLSSLLGPAASLLGGVSGAMGQEGESATSTQQLPSFLQGPVAGDLIPRTMGLLSDQAPGARAMGAQMTNLGGDLLRRGVYGNGFESVKLDAPTTATNPYLSGVADDMQRRTQEMLGANNLAIQGNSVASGGLGGSRQGVAQGIAAGKAADYLQGNLAGLYSGAYNADQNRALQKYGQDQSFYGQQRGQDLAQVSTGAGLLSGGLDAQWQPLKNANSVYGTYSPYGSKTTSTPDSGGGLQGLLGGALAGASFAQQAGWWK
jgi:hypothetical protein